MEEEVLSDRNRVNELKHERITLQKKTFTKWVNAFLEKNGASINDIFTEFSDGKLLVKLLESISGDKIGIASKGKLRIHQLENVSRVLDYVKKYIKLESIGAEDIVDGKEELILGLLWTIILRFSIADVQNESADAKSVKDALLIWCQRITKGYADVNIHNFTTCWRNGLAFNAIIHAHRQDLFDYNRLQANRHIENLSHAFDIAKEKFGIAKLLEPEDIDSPRPDEKSVMMYIGALYQYFSKIKKEKTGGKRINKLVMELMDIDDMKEKYLLMVTNLLDWIREKTSMFILPIPIIYEQIQEEMNSVKIFRMEEKPEKTTQRINIEIYFFQIQSQLSCKKYITFVPPSNASLSHLNKKWELLENAENERIVQLKEALLRQEEIRLIVEKFNVKAQLRENWLKEKKHLLDNEINLNYIQAKDISSASKRHQAFETDCKSGEIRFEVLAKLLLDLQKSTYTGIEKVQSRYNDIIQDWKKLLTTIATRKNSLTDLQNISGILEDIEEINDHLQSYSNITSVNYGATIQEVDELIEKNNYEVLQFTNTCQQLQDLQEKSKKLVKSNVNQTKLVEEKMKQVCSLKEDLKTTSEDRIKKLLSSKATLVLLQMLAEENRTVLEKIKLTESTEVGNDLISLTKHQRKHQLLIEEIKSYRVHYKALEPEHHNSLHTSPFFAGSVELQLKLLERNIEVLYSLANTRSRRLTEATLSITYYSNSKYVKSWLNEAMQTVSSDEIGHNLSSTQLLLKRHAETTEQVKTFKHDIDLLKRESKAIEQYTSTSNNRDNNETSTCYHGDYIILPTTIRSKDEPSRHFDAENVASQQKSIVVLYEQLCGLTQSKFETLNLQLLFHEFVQDQSELNNSILRFLNNLQRVDFHTQSLESVQKLLDTGIKLSIAYQNELYKLNDKAISLTGHPESSLISKLNKDTSNNLHKLFQDVDMLKENISCEFGATLFLADCSLLMECLSEKENQLFINYDKSNLNSIRRLQKQQQLIEKELKLVNTKVEDIRQQHNKLKTLKMSIHDQVDSKWNEIQSKFYQVSKCVTERSKDLDNAYGLKGFTLDSLEVMQAFKDAEGELSRCFHCESFDSFNQCLLNIKELKDEVLKLSEKANEVIIYGKKLTEDQTASKTISLLEEKVVNVNSLVTQQELNLNYKKDILSAQKELQKLQLKFEDFNVVMDLVGDEIHGLTAVSFEELTQRVQDIGLKVNMYAGKFNSYCGNRVNILSNSEISSQFDTLKRFIHTSMKKFGGLEKELLDLSLYKDFAVNVTDVLSWISEKCELLNKGVRSDAGVIQVLKENEKLHIEATSYFANKKRLENNGTLLVEDCHFASTDITDILFNLDCKWFGFLQVLKKNEKRCNDLILTSNVEASLQKIKSWLEETSKEISKPVISDNLQGAKTLAGYHKKLCFQFVKQEEEIKRMKLDFKKLIDDHEDLHGEIIKVEIQFNDLLHGFKMKQLLVDKEVGLHEFYQKIIVEELWITDQKSILSDLETNLSNQQKRSFLNSLQQSMVTHEATLTKFLEIDVDDNSTISKQIESRVQDLYLSWQQLIEQVKFAVEKCDKNTKIERVISNADIHIDWLDDKIESVVTLQYGQDLSSTERLIERQKILLGDVMKYKQTLKSFLKSKKNLTATTSEVSAKVKVIKTKYKTLEDLASAQLKSLHDLYNQMLFYYEVGNFKEFITDLNTKVNTDVYGENYDETLRLQSKFEQVSFLIKAGEDLFIKVNTLASNLIQIDKYPHKITIKNVTKKINAMWSRSQTKINQRETRLQRASCLHKIHEDISDLSNTINDYASEVVETLHKTTFKSQSIAQSQDNLKTLQLLTAVETSIGIRFKTIECDFAEIRTQYSGKSLEKLDTQVQKLKQTISQKQLWSKSIIKEHKDKINSQVILAEIQSIEEWYSIAKYNMDHLSENSIDIHSTLHGLSQLSILQKEIEVKNETLYNLEIENKKLLLIHDKAEQKTEKIRQEWYRMQEHLQELSRLYVDTKTTLAKKLSKYYAEKDLRKAEETLNTFQERFDQVRAKSHLEEKQNKLLEVEKILEQYAEKITNLRDNEGFKNSNYQDKLCILLQKLESLDFNLKNEKNDTAKQIELKLFREKLEDVQCWITQTLKRLRRELSSNLHHELQKQKRLHIEIGIYHDTLEDLGKLVEHFTDNSAVIEELLEVSTLWEEMINLSQQRDAYMSDLQVLSSVNDDYEVIMSYLKDKINNLKTCNLETSDLATCFKYQNMFERTKKELACDQLRIDNFEQNLLEISERHHNLTPKLNNILASLNNSYIDINKRIEEHYTKCEKKYQYLKILSDCKILDDEILLLTEQLSASNLTVGKTTIQQLVKEQTSIELKIKQICIRKKDICEEVLNIKLLDGGDVKSQRVLVEVHLNALNEEMQKRKLKLEVIEKLQIFLFDIKKLENYLEVSKETLSNKSLLGDAEKLCQFCTELTVQIHVKEATLQNLQDCGEQLAKEESFASAEVDRRFKNIRQNIEHIKFILSEKEKHFDKFRLIKNLKEQFESAESWIDRNNEICRSIDLHMISLEESHTLLGELKTLFSALRSQNDIIVALRLQASLVNDDNVDDRRNCILKSIEHEINVNEKNSILVNNNMKGIILQNKISEILQHMSHDQSILQDTLSFTNQPIATQEKVLSIIEAKLNSFQNTTQIIEDDFINLNDLSKPKCEATLNELRQNLHELTEKLQSLKLKIITSKRVEDLLCDINTLEEWMIKEHLGFERYDIVEGIHNLDSTIEEFKLAKTRVSTQKQRLDVLRDLDDATNENLHKRITCLYSRYEELLSFEAGISNKLDQAQLYLQLQGVIETIKNWMNEKKCLVENTFVKSDQIDASRLLKKFESLSSQFEKLKNDNEINQLQKHLLLLGDEFSEKVKLLIEDFTVECDNFRKNIDEKSYELKDALKIYVFIDSQNDVLNQIREKLAFLQSNNTGHDKRTATKLKWQNSTLINNLNELRLDITAMEEGFEGISQLTVFRYFSDTVSTNQGILHTLVSQSLSLATSRNKQLDDAIKLYQFKSELSSLNKWMQNQLEQIKTDDIGKNLIDCKTLLKETEDLSRYLLANENRITEFNKLSTEVMSHNLSLSKQIMRNTELVYEMWNDVKTLLEERLKTIQSGCRMHSYVNNLNELLLELKEAHSDMMVINLTEVDLTNIEVFQKNYSGLQIPINAVLIQVEDLLKKDESCSFTFNEHVDKIGKLRENLIKISSSVNEKLRNAATMLQAAESIVTFMKETKTFSNWLEEISSFSEHIIYDNSLMINHSETVEKHYQTTRNEFKARDDYYNDLVTRGKELNDRLTNMTIVVINEIAKIESKWNNLEQILNTWKQYIAESGEVTNLSRALDDADNWITHQEQIYLHHDIEEEFDSVNNALLKHNEFQNELLIQDEKINRLCLMFENGSDEAITSSCLINPIKSFRGVEIHQNIDTTNIRSRNAEELQSNIRNATQVMPFVSVSTETNLSNRMKSVKRVRFKKEHERCDWDGVKTIFYQLNDECESSELLNDVNNNDDFHFECCEDDDDNSSPGNHSTFIPPPGVFSDDDFDVNGD